MNEMFDNCFRQCLTNLLRHQVEVVVVHHHTDGAAVGLALGHHRIGEGAVYLDVPVFPGVVHSAVNGGCVGGAPHVVLEEPEERVAERVVELVVDAAGGVDVPERDTGAGQCGLDALTVALLPYPAVSFTHCAGHPGEVHIPHE